jgi:hypothetical protein
MIFNVTEFQPDNDRSTPAKKARVYPSCPIREVCFYRNLANWAAIERCQYLRPTSETQAECRWVEDHAP